MGIGAVAASGGGAVLAGVFCDLLRDEFYAGPDGGEWLSDLGVAGERSPVGMELLATGEGWGGWERCAAWRGISHSPAGGAVRRTRCRGAVKLSDFLVLAERFTAPRNAAAVFVGGAEAALVAALKKSAGATGCGDPGRSVFPTVNQLL